MSFKLALLVFALFTVLHESSSQYYGGYPTAYGNNYYGGMGGYGGFGYGGGYPSGGYYADYGYGYPYSGYVGKRSSGFGNEMDSESEGERK